MSRWSRRYINNSSYYHQIGSIYSPHCCHIFRGCVPDVVVPSYAGRFTQIPGKLGFVFHYSAVLSCARIIEYIDPTVVFVCLHVTLHVLHYHHYAGLSDGVEPLKCMSGAFCLECVFKIKSVLSFIFYAKCGTVCIQLTNFSYDNCTVSYHQHQIRSMTHLPLFRVRS